MTPHLGSFLGLSFSGFHRIAYRAWGPQEAEHTVVCVHGLTRQGRDFDVLARTLARAGWRVICPDLVGRGTSDWLTDPAGYTRLQYGADMNALIARLDIEEVDWIGTSLGSLVGMILAGQPGAPIRQLVINDIGPFIPGTAPCRLGLYLTNLPQRFANLAKAEAYIREIMALRPSHGGTVAAPHRAQHRQEQFRAGLHAALGSRHRRGLPPLAARQYSDVGAVGAGALPDAAATRGPVRPAARLDCAGDDPLRLPARAGRVRGGRGRAAARPAVDGAAPCAIR